MSISRDELQSMGIYQLRVVGRSVGVHLPTTFKKEDLITKILEILEGNADPHKRITKKGRPAKILKDMDTNLDRYFGKKSGALRDYYDYGFEDLETCCKGVKLSDIETVEVKGVVEIINASFALIIPNDKRGRFAIINRDMVNSTGVETGDLVVADSVLVSHDKPNTVVKIISINGVENNEIPSYIDFSNADEIEKCESCLYVNSTNAFHSLSVTMVPVMLGDSILMTAKNANELALGTYSVLDKMIKENRLDIVCIFTNTNKSYKNAFLKLENVEIFLSEFGDDDTYQVRMVQLALEYIDKIKNIEGRKVVLVIEELCSVITLLKRKGMVAEIIKLKKIFASTKCTDTNSFTVFYGAIEGSHCYDEYDNFENIKLKFLDMNSMQKLAIKVDMRASSRNELQFFNPEKTVADALRQKMLNCDDEHYLLMHSKCEEMALQAINPENFWQNVVKI